MKPHNLKIGTVVEVLPIAILLLDDSGAHDYEIIAIPTDETKQIISLDFMSWISTRMHQGKESY